jgi:prephenate dehydrogenase
VGVIAGLVHGLPGVVTDVGSLKVEICRAGGPRFVGGHPMAGTEKFGPEAADAGLFAARTVILTPTEVTEKPALALVEALWTSIGAKVVHMTAEAHDRAMAAVSQLPHVVAYALAGVVGRAPELAGLAGGSLQSGTRVAASDVELWTELMTRNHAALLPWIDAFAVRIGELRAAIALGDPADLHALLDKGRRGRAKVLP